ncbi:MAG: monovalent cation:H+ antiporter-2, family [Thermoanaerobaculia bacterium]|jgi:CPA2 family monovalent cation:H+ antiporter-2|nr:monovalent cation:H+ antiporter-2, family [Thermoanaerobaculia bacterium]
MLFLTPPPDVASIFIELGAATLGLALLSRFASRFGFSAIPLYLLAGLAFGNGGVLPLAFSQEFVHVGAEIGVVLLLFTLGLEYTGSELTQSLRTGVRAGVIDFVFNFTPGAVAALILGWPLVVAAAFGGITYVSSSGIIAKVLHELGRESSVETPAIVSILVFEDLAMALFLPLLSVALTGRSGSYAFLSVLGAIAAVGFVLLVALRFGPRLSRAFSHKSDEIILLTCFGMVLLVSGLAHRVQVSAAVGAFLVGIAMSGPLAAQAHRVISPVRDLFAAVFFFFFGLQVAPAALVPVLPLAMILVAVTATTKLLSGWWSAKLSSLDGVSALRVGATLIARGEFSIVIAGLAVAAGAEPQVASVAAAYVLLCAIVGPVAARAADPVFALISRSRSSYRK